MILFFKSDTASCHCSTSTHRYEHQFYEKNLNEKKKIKKCDGETKMNTRTELSMLHKILEYNYNYALICKNYSYIFDNLLDSLLFTLISWKLRLNQISLCQWILNLKKFYNPVTYFISFAEKVNFFFLFYKFTFPS